MDGIGSSMQKKVTELERMAEVLITGEQLRYEMICSLWVTVPACSTKAGVCASSLLLFLYSHQAFDSYE